MQRLLAGPMRPGQAYTMPGCNYDGLYRQARQFKFYFDANLEKGRPVCLFTDDRVVMAAALLASLSAGPALLIPDALSAAALKDLYRMTHFTAVIGHPDKAPGGIAVIDPETLTEEAEALAAKEKPDPHRPWVRLFTGGSTGYPQLWTKTPANLLGEVEYLLSRFDIGSGDRILATVPALHIYGLLYSLLLPLAAAARVAAATPSFPAEIKKQMAEMAPTIFVSLPVHYRALKDNPPDKGALRLAFSSDGPLPEEDGRAFSAATGVDLVEVYGTTATGGIATRCRAKGESGLIPCDCIEHRITGEELDVRSSFLSRELPVRSSGWFTAADRVQREGGGFVVVGRRDNIVGVGGHRVDLEKIRQAMAAMDGIDEALVLANAPDTGRDREIVALAVGSLGDPETKAALEAILEPHERPRRILRVDRIPMAANGKPDRRAIRKLTETRHIRFEPAGLKVAFDEEISIHELAAGHGINLRADCGGMGVCGKCRVRVDPKENFSSPTEAELEVFTTEQVDAGLRLACQTKPTGPAAVFIPENLAESTETSGKTGISRSYPADSPIQRVTIDGPAPGLKTDNQPESLVDWLAAKCANPVPATADRAALQQLARYRGRLKDFTLVVHEEHGILRMAEGPQPVSLGLAVDLGTTSVAGYLCDLQTGKLLAAEACVNLQRRFGEDVISRISRINENEGQLTQFQGLAAEGINSLLSRCLEKTGFNLTDIDEVAVCGNTTMQQVFAGLHPYGLGVFPYFPLTLTPPPVSAGALGLAVDPAVPVFLMPVVSGFVGGDTMAAILADRPHERDEITLIVDIGTNGEVVLGNRKRLWATSCATGPALEGAQISCGMRAVSGAIYRVWPDGEGIAFEVMGDGEVLPEGICGSGIIDAVASLHQLGIILPNGRLNESSPCIVTDESGVGRHYTLAGREQTATGTDIAVTLKDVRQIQLAKAALCTGIEFLMRKAGIKKIDRTILTGAFGARFNWKNALAIGMLPPVVADGEVVPADNLAGVGVVMTLLDKKLRPEARDLCRRIRYLELAADPAFAMAFAKATAFPENALP
jgi:uncharacterized 2Fe-2S/4Fe-4S cluster protein (DUF4445 family)/acyl-coenzyme A synthetase/AMP-(fatty) acid ligase